METLLGKEQNSFTRGQMVFLSKIQSLGTDIQRRIKEGKASFVDSQIYIASAIVAAKVSELFGENLDANVGVSNIDKGRVKTDLLVESIAVEFASDAAITDATKVVYSNVLSKSELPAAIANGEIEITAEGKKIIPAMPLADFFGSPATTVAGHGEVRHVKTLQAPKLLQKGQKLEITVRQPDGSAFSVANNFVKVSLIGSGIE